MPESVGRYRLVEEIGRGAMGVVYRALDPALDRSVAIKVIRVGDGGTEVSIHELEVRFLREAKLSARINHPGVVTVYDAGREGDQLYLVMELVEGESLATRMRRGDFPEPTRALELAAQVADALAAAHAINVVHRDVKPANILVNRDGRAKVSDFGVAKAMGEDTGLTRTGMVVGSPAYMAPEQIRGQAVDGRADLFSLGVILYELLLRRKPFPADTLTTLIFQILNDDPFADPAVSTVLDEGLRQFLAQALAKDPALRPRDAAAFAAAARGLAAGNALRDSTETVLTRSTGAPVAAVDLETTGPTRVIAPPAPPPTPPPATAPPAPVGAAGPVSSPPSGSGRRGLLAVVLVVAGLCAIVVAAAILLRSFGHRGPTPALEVAAAGGGSPAARGPDVGVPATAGPVAVLDTPTPTVPVAVPTAIPPTPRPTATPTPGPTRGPRPTLPPPTAVPPTAPPVVASFRCRRGAVFNVSPEDAKVEIEGTVIGIADDWDGKGGGKVYYFPGPGTYYVKLSMIGYPTKWIRVVVDPAAKDEVADVDTDLD